MSGVGLVPPFAMVGMDLAVFLLWRCQLVVCSFHGNVLQFIDIDGSVP